MRRWPAAIRCWVMSLGGSRRSARRRCRWKRPGRSLPPVPPLPGTRHDALTRTAAAASPQPRAGPGCAQPGVRRRRPLPVSMTSWAAVRGPAQRPRQRSRVGRAGVGVDHRHPRVLRGGQRAGGGWACSRVRAPRITRSRRCRGPALPVDHARDCHRRDLRQRGDLVQGDRLSCGGQLSRLHCGFAAPRVCESSRHARRGALDGRDVLRDTT